MGRFHRSTTMMCLGDKSGALQITLLTYLIITNSNSCLLVWGCWSTGIVVNHCELLSRVHQQFSQFPYSRICVHEFHFFVMCLNHTTMLCTMLSSMNCEIFSNGTQGNTHLLYMSDDHNLKQAHNLVGIFQTIQQSRPMFGTKKEQTVYR
jgi:hypothetical protein